MTLSGAIHRPQVTYSLSVRAPFERDGLADRTRQTRR